MPHPKMEKKSIEFSDAKFYAKSFERKFAKNMKYSTISDKILGRKQRNPAKLDRTRKVSYLLLRDF